MKPVQMDTMELLAGKQKIYISHDEAIRCAKKERGFTNGKSFCTQ